jgi:probable HAF family extracellular repeat protein
MKRKPRLCFAVLNCALLVTLVTSWAPAQTPRYVVTDLGDLPGGSDSTRGYGLNNLGQIVGGSRTTNPAGGTSGLQHPFLWTPSRPNGTTGSMIDLGTFGNSTSGSARAINDSGQIVGDDGHQSFLWTPESPNGATGNTVVVGPPVADYHARTVAAINNRGQVVGTNDPGILPQHGYLWTPDRPNGPTGTLTESPICPADMSLASPLRPTPEGRSPAPETSRTCRATPKPASAPAFGRSSGTRQFPTVPPAR